jgi:methionyl-tRNA formyltransferase
MSEERPVAANIVFMGTPDFAVPSLEILINNNYPIQAVVTAPDRPRGRGMEVQPTPIKPVALR